jgi:glycosyltransferase involved in cell wall biosynthesis
MHIVHIAGALMGGPLSAITEWTRLQVKAGHRVSLIYSPLRDPVESFRAALPAEVALYPLDMRRDIHPIADFRATRATAKLLRSLHPDIVHMHSSKAGALGRIAAWLTHTPSVYSPHGLAYLRTDVGILTRAFYFMLEWLLGLAGTVTVACSPSELEAMRSIPGAKTFIPNGIDFAALRPATAITARTKLRIVLCGRITAQKNPLLACAIAQASPPDWHWAWLGDGDMRDSVEHAGRIEVLGWTPRSEALDRLSASDVMVTTSSWEGMPIAVLEAMALGLPVVATDAVGNRDLIRSGENGFIATDVAGFLRALNCLAQSPELRRAMGEAGRQRVLNEYDQDKLGARWINLYARLCAKSEHPVSPATPYRATP